MRELYDLDCEVDRLVSKFLDDTDAESVLAVDLGLDYRSFYGPAYVTPDFICVRGKQDRTLQYFGGFEYVGKEYRYVYGEYVFYDAEDERVAEHICKALHVNCEDEDEDATGGLELGWTEED